MTFEYAFATVAVLCVVGLLGGLVKMFSLQGEMKQDLKWIKTWMAKQEHPAHAEIEFRLQNLERAVYATGRRHDDYISPTAVDYRADGSE